MPNGDLNLTERLAVTGSKCLELYKKADEQGAIEFLQHPFKYADILIRIGYEPFPPIERRTFLRLYIPHLVLPGILPYARYIFFADGFTGTFRCFWPCFVRKHLISKVHQRVESLNPFVNDDPDVLRGPQLYQKFTKTNLMHFFKQTSWNLITKIAVTIAAQPLHVVTVRCFSQLVQKEDSYRFPVRCMIEILKTEGIKGFFAGLGARLVGDFVYISTSAVIYLSVMQSLQPFQYALSPDNLDVIQQITPHLTSLIATPYAQQFYNVSDIMIVNGTSLALGNPPYMPIYKGWFDCWGNIRNDVLFKTSSGIFSRSYHGPRVITEEGRLTATKDHFGPTYFPPEGQNVPYLLRDFYAPLQSTNFDASKERQETTNQLKKARHKQHILGASEGF